MTDSRQSIFLALLKYSFFPLFIFLQFDTQVLVTQWILFKFFLKTFENHQHCVGFNCDVHGPLNHSNQKSINGMSNKISLYLRIVNGTKGSFSRKKQQHPLEHTATKYTIWRWNRADFDFYHYCSPQIFFRNSHHITKRYSIWNWGVVVGEGLGSWCIDP